ncbi:glycosyltransferase [Skermania sp. ID1734]|uniref:glycosyltransferase n=1 Tax=Skermania sp. ID1734 TaxID=2597516 RepID=UPI00163D5B06|nr:glycosyltransferase [Skermania sp. ID1734]
MSGHLVLLAYGTQGDIDPYLVLGRELHARGHHVRVVTPDRYAGAVERAGLEQWSFGLDVESLLVQADWQTWKQGGRQQQADGTKEFLRYVLADMPERLGEIDAACAGAAAILSPSWGGMSHFGADSRGIPAAFLQLQPWEPSATYPNLMLSPDRSLPGPLNRATHRVAAQAHWHLIRKHINDWRHERYGLEPLPWRYSRSGSAPVLCGFSRHIVTPSPDWGSNVAVTGNWFDDDEPKWTPPQALTDYLAAGATPIFVGFGSWLPANAAGLYELVVDAARQAGVRAVVQVDPETAADPHTFGDDIYAIGFVPYRWMFERVAAVVHHGGAGTTALAVRAGVPNVVCPFFADQNFWASRVAAIHAGPKPIPVQKLTADRLAEAVRTAVSDKTISATVAGLGAAMREERGAAVAGDVLDEWLRSECGVLE